MSEDDRDIDIESDEGEETADSSDSRSFRPLGSNQYLSQAAKRAHHNALERKRRDHIKDSFSSLRDSVPSLVNEKVVSRAQILKKAAEYILYMKKKNGVHQQDIDDLKRQNALLDSQIRQLEKAKASGTLTGNDPSVDNSLLTTSKMDSSTGYHQVSGSDTSDSEYTRGLRRNKKLKVSSLSTA